MYTLKRHLSTSGQRGHSPRVNPVTREEEEEAVALASRVEAALQ